MDSAGCQPGQCQRIWCAVRIQVLPFLHRSWQTRTLLLNEKAKRGEQSPQLGWMLFKQGTQEGVCTELWFPQSITVPAFCMISPCVCSALWVSLPWPLHFNDSPEGREVEIEKGSSAVGILAFARDMALLWLQKRRTMLWLEASRKGIGTNSWLHAAYTDDGKISHSDAMGKKQIAPSAHKSGWGELDQEPSLWQAGLYTVHSGRDASWCFSVSCKQTMVWQDQKLLLLPDRAFPHLSLSEQKAGSREVTWKRALIEPCINLPLRLGNFLFALKCNNVNKLSVTLPGLFRTLAKTTGSSHPEPRDANTTGTSHLGLHTLNESEGLCSLHKRGIVFQGWGCELRAIFRQYK